MKTKRKRWKRAVLSALDLPLEADGETLKITMVGTGDLLVENHRGVLECGLERIRLMSTVGIIRIEGTMLTLSEFGTERAYIRGLIGGWRFEDRK